MLVKEEKQMKISIVIPAYNEEATITELIGLRSGMPPFSFKLSCGCLALGLLRFCPLL